MNLLAASPSGQPHGPLLEHCHAVLFDLDGTLADTAPDLAAAVNKMRVDRGLPPLPLNVLRPFASAGARGLIRAAFDMGLEHGHFATMREEFLANYAAQICIKTVLFSGIAELLDTLDERGMQWGIVTNKIGRLTVALIKLLGLDTRARCVVSGDTTPHSKPHPAPLLYAAKALNKEPARIVYVGDDARDIQAGAAAGMVTIAAAYGYCGVESPPATWHATHLVDSPTQLQQLLQTIPLTSL